VVIFRFGNPRALLGGRPSTPLFPILFLLLLPVVHDKGVSGRNETCQNGQEHHKTQQEAPSRIVRAGGRRAARFGGRVSVDFAVRSRKARGTIATKVVLFLGAFASIRSILAATPVVAKRAAARPLFGVNGSTFFICLLWVVRIVLVAKDGRDALAKLGRSR
jgi:hypothetical protein